MKLAIAKAHLQYVVSFMAAPLPPPSVFFEDASTFSALFHILDRKATYFAILKTNNPDLDPSHFGATVVQLSKEDLLAQNSFISPIIEALDQEAREYLKQFAKNLFLNIAGWYISPMFAANNFRAPYMPRAWINKFTEKKMSLSPNDHKEYLNNVVQFLFESGGNTWGEPWTKLAFQVGHNGSESLLLAIDMFRHAIEEGDATSEMPLRQNRPPRQPGESPSILPIHASIIDFINSIPDDDGEQNKAPA